jgi:hypothetical protein
MADAALAEAKRHSDLADILVKGGNLPGSPQVLSAATLLSFWHSVAVVLKAGSKEPDDEA